MTGTDVFLEVGRTWTFASAVEWPGWSRRGKGEDAALQVLADYADRYAAAVGESVDPTFVVIGRATGTATTEFGAPDVVSDADWAPLSKDGAARLATLLERVWAAFDGAVAGSAAELTKGPRGGGRNRDAIVDHVREAERSYARKFGARVPPRRPWAEQRAAIVDAIRNQSDPDPRWPLRYAVRRTAWHVLDHAWEIEDKQPARG
jgi:hypothetical protein